MVIYRFARMPLIRNHNVKAIVAFEPVAGLSFPEGEEPPPIANAYDTVAAEPVPLSQFQALTKIPVMIFYGDNIPAEPVTLPAQDSWHTRAAAPCPPQRPDCSPRGIRARPHGKTSAVTTGILLRPTATEPDRHETAWRSP